MEEIANKRGRFLWGGFLAIAGSVFLAVGGIFGQMVYMYNETTAFWLVPIRLLSSGVIMLVISMFRGNRIIDIWKERRDRVDIILFGIFGAAVGQFGFNLTVQYSSAAIATVLIYTAPVMMLIFVTIKDRRLPKLYEVISVLLVLVGTITISTHLRFGTFIVAPKALFFGFLSAAGFCVYTRKPQRLFRKFDIFAVIGWGMLIGGLSILPFCPFWRISVIKNAALVGRMVVVIFGGTIIAFILYQKGVAIVGGIVGTILSSMETVGAVVLSVLLLGTKFEALDIIGFVMIMATVPIIALAGNDKGKSAS